MVNLTSPASQKEHQMPIEYDAGQVPHSGEEPHFFAPPWNRTPYCSVQSLVQGCQMYGMHAQNGTYKECPST